MADLLDSAQKQIDDAAKAAGTQPPVEPDPEVPASPPPAPTPEPKPEPEPQAPEETPSDIVETILSAPTPPAAPPPDEAPPEPPPLPKKKGISSTIIAALLFLFLTLPLTVFYVSQQRQLADVRSRAAGSPTCKEDCLKAGNTPIECNGLPACPKRTNTPTPKPSNTNTPTPRPANTSTPTPTPRWTGGTPTCYEDCLKAGNTPSECRALPACGKTPTPIPTKAGSCKLTKDCGSGFECVDGQCMPPGEEYCRSKGGVCRSPNTGTGQPVCQSLGRLNCPADEFCVKCGSGATSTPTPTKKPGEPTDKPTATPAPQCRDLNIYKDGAAVADPTTLRAGDAIVLAVKGNSATKGRIRVNGGTFTETTTKNAGGEYTVDFTIPTNVTTFTIEAEVFIGGAWR